jgi:fructokinase
MLYSPEEVAYAQLKTAKIFHFGSISLISEPSRSATLAALATARENGILVSYDPNLRLVLWPDAAAAKSGMMSVWDSADIIKVSGDELEFLTGLSETEQAVKALWTENLRLMVVTLGKTGCAYFTPEVHGEVPGFQVTPVDTTGAGDGFVAGLLKGLLTYPQAWGDEKQLRQACRLANAVGALTTTSRGAIPALPSLEQVNAFLAS